VIQLSEHPDFTAWRQAWRECPRQWWRVVLAVLAFFGGLVAAAVAANFLLLPVLKSAFPDAAPLFKELVGIFILGLSFLIALLSFLWAKEKLHGESPSILAFRRGSDWLRTALQSGGIWLALFLIAELALYGSGRLELRLATYEGAHWLLLGVAALVFVGVQAATEEFVFRGYLLPVLASTMSLLGASALTILVFVVGHPGSGLWGTLMVTVYAVVVTFAVIRTGSVSFGAGAHVANNLAMFLLFPGVENAENTPADATALVVACLIWLAWVEHNVRRADQAR